MRLARALYLATNAILFIVTISAALHMRGSSKLNWFFSATFSAAAGEACALLLRALTLLTLAVLSAWRLLDHRLVNRVRHFVAVCFMGALLIMVMAM